MANDKAIWADVDTYFGDLLIPADEAMDAALAANHKAGLPQIDVTNLQGKFLELLVRISGARRVLELGTLGGYSTLWLARALPEGGRVVTLELDPHHAEIAQINFRSVHLEHRIELHVGPAVKRLAALVEAEPREPYDLIFIDADKESYPEYLKYALLLARPGTLLIADNVVRQGKVADPACDDPRVQGVRRFTEMLSAEPRLRASVLQTVGVKGYDGLALAVVVR
jgi:predicted O-methyltransferase YrrM